MLDFSYERNSHNLRRTTYDIESFLSAPNKAYTQSIFRDGYRLSPEHNGHS